MKIHFFISNSYSFFVKRFGFGVWGKVLSQPNPQKAYSLTLYTQKHAQRTMLLKEMKTLASCSFFIETNVVSNDVCSIPPEDSLSLPRRFEEIMPNHSMLPMKSGRRAVHPTMYFTITPSVSSSTLLTVRLITWHQLHLADLSGIVIITTFLFI